jgi:hypothetical protein
MSAIPQEQVSSQPLPLAVTPHTDLEKHYRTALNALNQLEDHHCTLSQAQADARRFFRQQLGGGR